MIFLYVIGIMAAVFAGGLVVLFGLYCLGMMLEYWAMGSWIRSKGDKVEEERRRLHAVHEEGIQ